MDSSEIEKTARAWIAMHVAEAGSESYESNFWAYERVSELCDSNPEDCWRVIATVRNIDSSDSVLSNLAAGPLEDLLLYHGADFIDRIEEVASKDEKFRRLLGAVWQNDIAETVWVRVKRAAA